MEEEKENGKWQKDSSKTELHINVAAAKMVTTRKAVLDFWVG